MRRSCVAGRSSDFGLGSVWLLALALAVLVGCRRAPPRLEPPVSPAGTVSSVASGPVRGASQSTPAFGNSVPNVVSHQATECPTQLPEPGSSCQGARECTFEDAPLEYCSTSAACRSGAWEVHPRPPNCPPDFLASPSTCPKKADVIAGPCAKLGALCRIGSTDCLCHDCAADSCLGSGKKWVCLVRLHEYLLGCPEAAPLLGAPCSDPGVRCDYGSWKYGLAKRRICNDGHWIAGEVQGE